MGAMTNPVAYAVVRVGRPEHHMVSEVYRDEWRAEAIARALIEDTGSDWRVWPLVFGAKPNPLPPNE